MNRSTIVYWTATALFFLFESVLPAFTSHTELAVEGVRHLGYPDYFRVMLTVFKVLGGLALIVPMVPARVKEWAYAGFTFNLIAAAISHGVIDGWGNGQTFFPLIVLAVLLVSYVQYRRRVAVREQGGVVQLSV
jgi:hypothetical protein